MNVKNLFQNIVTVIAGTAIALTPIPLAGFMYDSITVHAADAIEPGSPQSFFEWSVATLEYLNGLSNSEGVTGWGKETIKYALDMRSLMVAYQTWYNNQNYTGETIYFTSYSGYVKIRDDGQEGSGGVRYMAATAANKLTADYNPPSQFQFAVIPFGAVRYNPDSNYPTISNSSDKWGQYVEVNCYSNYNNSLDVSNYDAKRLSLTFYLEASWAQVYPNNLPSDGYARQASYNYLSAYQEAGITFDRSDFHPQSFVTGDSLPDKVKEIQDQYPDDVIDQIPDIGSPEDDESEGEHDCNCNCVVHVDVTVQWPTDWQPQWPTYDVQDVPEPSDFDFNPLETLDPSETDQISFNMEELPEDALTGAGFWFGLMDDWAEMFEVKGLIIVMLSIALLLFFVVR